jgi:aldose 1-epimerase
MPISKHAFGITTDGAAIDRYTLVNANGLSAQIMTYGGTLTALRVPDSSGVLGGVVLGFETLVSYLSDHPYFGTLIGRYGNRIAGDRFELNGVTYTLARNDGPNHLHGGPDGFHRRVWRAREHASADRPSLADLTNHAYFNLAGHGDILGHELELAASRFLPIDATLIPLGELRDVRDTPMDFTVPMLIGARIDADDEQLHYGQGYDHTWVLDKPAGGLGSRRGCTSDDGARHAGLDD